LYIRLIPLTFRLVDTSVLLTPLDFGCGDAQLAKDLSIIKRTQPKQKNNNKKKSGEEDDEDDDDDDEKLLFKVHSFDLVSPNKFVTACDMANVPLQDKSVDVCVFCLSLMGTNLADFIREAHRVLKNDGRVKIAEVRSRIEYSFSKKGAGKTTNTKNNSNNKNNKNNKESDKSASSTKDEKTEGTLDEFVGVLGKLGFECVRPDRTNTMFLLLELKKNGKKPSKKLEFSAKPCIYKRR
jgi:ribosomal RNA-processing protein 8